MRAPDVVSGGAPVTGRGRRSPSWGSTAVAVGAGLLGAALVACGPDEAEGPAIAVTAGFPAPMGARPASRVEPGDFAGAETCAECHAEQYDAWVGSTHGRAGGEPGPGVVVAPFDGTPIRFADGVVLPRVRDGTYEFVVRQDGFQEVSFPVSGVVGGGHMLGGGTQGFFTSGPDGTERFLAFDWSRTDGRWFCNTGTRLDQGWVPITPDMRLADCGDWPASRVLGTESRFTNCQGCHGSQIRLAFAPEERAWSTHYTSLAVNCESCHGPAREHVERARAEDFGSNGLQAGLGSLTVMGKDASLEVCFQCHALKDVLSEGYLPGDSLGLFYALKYPVLGDTPYYPDARIRSFAYQGTHLASACYLDGAMDCASCHDPHGQGYWDQFRNPLESPFDDGQCTSCHASKAEPLEAHTFHPPGSDGSRCVNCHMPYLQHPEVGPGVRFARSDHTIPVPRPAFDTGMGVENACAQCHDDRPTAALQAQVEAWWGEIKPHRPLVAGQLQVAAALENDGGGAATMTRDRAAELLLRPDQKDPLIQFQALARFLTLFLEADMPSLEAPVTNRLLDLTRSPDLDVRALALASLHWARGEDPEVKRALVAALSGENGWALRQRWALALGFLADGRTGDEAYGQAQVGYAKALEISPDDPRILSGQGLSLYRAGRFREAAAVLQRAARLDPQAALTRVNLGIAQAAVGDVAAAQQTYVGLLEMNPNEPLAWFNLGNLLQRSDRLAEAEEAYARASMLDPGLERAYFHRARALILLNRIPEALEPARRALELAPENDLTSQMVRDLEQALGVG
ncbi:MAG: tetratricopeptide repeat protein [Gemmatimonadales bacterium]|nr:MAG: tetratricopeptide repeat protein [Gemmatimonadales bacterium]